MERKIISTLGRFTLEIEKISGGTNYNVILLDRENQIGVDDGLGEMILDTSDEQLMENCELDGEDTRFVQESTARIREWLAGLGIKVVRED